MTILITNNSPKTVTLTLPDYHMFTLPAGKSYDFTPAKPTAVVVVALEEMDAPSPK